MDFLKKHARFLVVLVVLAVLLFFANRELADSSRRVEAARGSTASLLKANYSALFKDAKAYNGEPAVVEGRKIQDRTQNLQQVESARNQMLTFETDPQYTLASLGADAGDDDKVQYYRNKASQLSRELAFKRYFRPEGDTALGFKAGEDRIAAARVPDLLRRLDIVATVSASVGRTGVTWLNKLAFKAVDKDLEARRLPAVPTADGEAPYLQSEGLEIEVQAGEQALYNFLLDLQRPMKGDSRTRYLAVERFKLEKADLLDPADNLITATVLIVAYRVNESSSYPVDRSAPESQQSKVGQPRSFRDR
ncbi:MAG: hypothetical protein KF754_15160 [Planctomycetes bacterium]|nr:hypothetical protein [Planctomycetota bacterium]